MGIDQLSRCFFRFGVAVVLVLLVSCQGPVKNRAPQSAPPMRVTLAPGDVVRLTFSGATELNLSQKIQADGRLSLPHVGEVPAAGKTIAQLQEELLRRYQSQLQVNDVLVMLESGVTRVFISGAVRAPGPLGFDRPTTILQAIMQAGGPNPFANMGRVQIIRLVGGQEQTEVIDLRPTLAGRTTSAYYVRDGDVISVPQKAF